MTLTNRQRILCVEDDADMIELIRVILERRGFEVIGVLGGRAALEAIRREQPDLVLLDLMMPGVGGWEVFRQMKADENLRDIPVVVVTAKVTPMDKALGLHVAKVDDYITKPFGLQGLADSVERVLKKK
jgi:CheY-like chemotaxis protein